MKQITNYINERLHITSKPQYSCQPTTKKELQEIIIQRIKEDGYDCDLNDIDVSNITDMSKLFNANPRKGTNDFGNEIFKDFNGDISRWDVSNVKNMDWMFGECKKFNCDLSRWDVSNVIQMFAMFCGCVIFNCDLSHWDVANVTNMRGMFSRCYKFNGNISRWNVSRVTDMSLMFFNCDKFNCNISKWDVSNVEYMERMFYGCTDFNQNLDSWNVSNAIKNITNMTNAFKECPTQPKWYDKHKYETNY